MSQVSPLIIVSLVCLTAIGCGTSRKAAIESVLAQDSGSSSNVKSISEVVTRMRNIDLDGCPDDFRSAYVKHIHAWESAQLLEVDAKSISDRYNSTSALVESFLRGFVFDFGMVGEAGAAIDKFTARQQQISLDIQRTFQDVETVAIRYGAKLPKR